MSQGLNHAIDITLSLLKGQPQHRLLARVNGQIAWAWHLTAIDATNHPKRIVCFDHPQQIYSVLPFHIQNVWEQYNRDLSQLRRDWRYGSMATLKRVIREHCNKQHNLLSNFKLEIVCYRHGAVPALVVDEIRGLDGEPWSVALLPAPFEGEAIHGESGDDEKWELLESLNMFLPYLLTQYYENMSNYLKVIFFGADDNYVLRYCLRIRQIIEQSISQKLHLIKDCPATSARAYELSNTLKNKYAIVIEEAVAVSDFVHLLVNYVYRFFCIKDRVNDYAGRIETLRPANSGLMDGNTHLSFVQRCATHLIDMSEPEPFLNELDRGSMTRPKWLQNLGEVTAMVAEIARFTAMRRNDTPRIFISHHFNVVESKLFCDAMQQQADLNNNFISVTGYALPKHIRWSLLARIWLSDHQVFFLPASATKNDGTDKNLSKPKEDWVTLELLYGMLIDRPQTFVVGAPPNEAGITAYRKHLSNYTEDKEIPQIDAYVWNAFIGGARARLSQYFHNREYKTFDTQNINADWATIEEDVIQKSGRDLMSTLCTAWSYFFNSEDWSIVQLLIELNKSVTIAELQKAVQHKLRIDDPRFKWARTLSVAALTNEVRRRAKKVGVFAFVFAGEEYEPIFMDRRKGKIVLKIDCYEVCEKLTHQLGLVFSWDHASKIRDAWLKRGPD